MFTLLIFLTIPVAQIQRYTTLNENFVYLGLFSIPKKYVFGLNRLALIKTMPLSKACLYLNVTFHEKTNCIALEANLN